MKDVAEYLRWITPFLDDKQRYSCISWFHVIIQVTLLFFFFCIRSFFIRVVVLLLVFGSILSELYYRECALSLLEREFSTETWNDILDDIFEKFDWKVTRAEKTVGFTCFNIGVFLMLFLFTIYEVILNYF